MSIQLGSAYGKIIIDSSGVTVGVGNATKSLGSFEQVATKVGSTLKSVGQAMTIGLTLPILAVGSASITAASNYEEAKNKALVVFADMADGIVESSNRASQTLGISKKEYLDYASSIGAALTAGGMGIKQATDLAEQAVKHFADLASFHNTSVEDAAMAWQSAIRGQYEPIQKYFPFITDTYLKTYGIANGMLDANTKTLTANQRATILNAIALNEKLNPALNDFAETSNGMANSTRRMQAEMKNSLITLGENLLPIALKVVQGLNKMLEAFNNAPPFVQKAVMALAGFIALLGPVLMFIGTVISAIGSIAGLVSSFGGLAAVAGVVGPILTTIVGGFASMAVAALPVVGPILLIIGALALLYFAFKNNFMGITTTAKQLWEIIKYYFGLIVKRITDSFKNINWVQIGKYILSGLANGMLAGIPSLIVVAAKAAAAALDAIKRRLGIASDSKEAIKLGKYTYSGFATGIEQMEKIANPNRIAKAFAKPITNMTTAQSTNNTFHLNGGLTLRDVDQLMNQKIDKFSSQLARSMRGA